MSEPATVCNTAVHAYTVKVGYHMRRPESAEQLIDYCSRAAARQQQQQHQQQKQNG